jgi:putative membrane protein
MLQPLVQRNDKTAYWLIGIFSFIVFTAVVILGRIQLSIPLSFDVHIFARINAFINSSVSVLLLAGLYTIKTRQYKAHRNVMMGAMLLSVVFLVSYILHHLLSGETKYPADAPFRTAYLIILFSHIILAGSVLPLILLSAYRAMTAQFADHKFLARYTWPVWFYVSVTGVVVYFMISPYYQ